MPDENVRVYFAEDLIPVIGEKLVVTDDTNLLLRLRKHFIVGVEEEEAGRLAREHRENPDYYHGNMEERYKGPIPKGMFIYPAVDSLYRYESGGRSPRGPAKLTASGEIPRHIYESLVKIILQGVSFLPMHIIILLQDVKMY